METLLNQQTSADWWIPYKDKGLDAVSKHLLAGNLQRLAAVPRTKGKPKVTNDSFSTGICKA